MFHIKFVEIIHEVCGELFRISNPLPQGRHLDRDDTEPVVQILPEIVLIAELRQRQICCRNVADVQVDLPDTAHAHHLVFLNDAQEFALEMLWQSTYFVQKDGAAVRRFEEPFFSPFSGPCKSTFFISE